MGTTQPIRKEDELYSFRMYYADEKPNVRNYTLIVLGLNTALRIGDLLSLNGHLYTTSNSKAFTTIF